MHYQSIQLANYTDQQARWPQEGRHILAQYDAESIIVYQAYRPAIGLFAVEHGYFGGEFSLNRMSWIKPNFLWMMYRSNWAQSPGQEMVLAIRLQRRFFDKVLQHAVPSSYDPSLFATTGEWQTAVQHSEVRLQWDPDHDPYGDKCTRRAIQLGLRGKLLEEYSRDAIVEIIDVTPLVTEQHAFLQKDIHLLQTPEERIYQVLTRSEC